MPSEVQGSNTAAARPRVAVVIPCYREVDHIGAVISGIGEGVARIIVVDDACPDHTGDHVRAQCADPRVEVIVHERNTGVGGATLTGYRRALETGSDIVVKLDGDGQMDPALIPALIEPIAEGEADYAKGNRFHQLDHITQMPALRIAGNLVLSFACKLSSGYWNIFDPTNGYTAIHAKVAERLPFGKISKGYFFESDMLFRLNLLRAVVADVPMHARYGDERSGLRISRALFEFTAKHWINTAKRILYSYFLRDFNAASVELVLGMVLFGFGVVFGALKWYESSTSGVVTTAGTVFIAALPIILGSQMLIAFLDFDTRNIPAAPIHRRL